MGNTDRTKKHDIVVFTATKRPGGLDVVHDSLVRQNMSVLWVVGDDLFYVRHDEFKENCVLPYVYFDAYAWRLADKDLYRTLAHAFNFGLFFARKVRAELFVTLQDFISIPDDGLRRFVDMGVEFPDSLLTGLCSHSVDPTADYVNEFQTDGDWTIFPEPWHGRPREIAWHDVRDTGTGGYVEIDQVRWEANWGAVPSTVLHDTDVECDEAYDRGVAYENQDFAMRAKERGYGEVWLDEGNHALALPHRAYFPWEEQRDMEHNNKDFHEGKWVAR